MESELLDFQGTLGFLLITLYFRIILMSQEVEKKANRRFCAPFSLPFQLARTHTQFEDNCRYMWGDRSLPETHYGASNP